MTGSVRFRAVLAFAVLGASISAAASKCGSLSITSVLPAPYLSRGSLLVPRFPCPSLRCGRKLARQGLVWIFLRHRRLVWVSLSPLSSASVSRTCVHLTQFPRSTLCVVGLCALISAPGRALRVAGLLWPCFGSLCLPSVLRGLCALASPHSVAEVICFSFSCAGRAVCPAQVCMPPFYDTPGPQFASAVFVCPVTLGHLGQPSVLQGLCALAGFVCSPLSVL